jgi:hypothetical protein
MKWLLWVLFALCPVGMGLGIYGILISSHLREFATVEVRGISPWIFEEMVCGAIILFMYVCTVAMLRRSVDPTHLKSLRVPKPKLHPSGESVTS